MVYRACKLRTHTKSTALCEEQWATGYGTKISKVCVPLMWNNPEGKVSWWVSSTFDNKYHCSGNKG